MSDFEGDNVEELLADVTSDESFVDSNSGESDDDSGDTDAEDSGGEGDGEDAGGAAPVEGLWLPIIGEDAGPAPVNFTAVPGPKHAPPPDARPIEYVNLFFTPHFLADIVAETNRYANQWVAGHQQHLHNSPQSRVHKWIKQGQTDVEEMRAFLGLVLNMGLIQKPNLQAYWDSSHKSQATPWFTEHFSRDRFQLLLKFLHFADNTNMPDRQDPNYKLYKIQPLIDHFQQKFLYYYHPHRDISIDESMIGYKGKTPHLRQFMPNKRHARFGIKLWCLSDSTNGYLCRFEVCKGAHNPREAANPHGATYALVTQLMEDSDFLDRGHHLCLDNYFSSPVLFQALYARNTTATGTVRTHRRGLPRDCVTRRLRNREVSERRKGPLLCVAYQDGSRKPVLLSTAATAGFTEVQNRRGNMTLKPNIVLLYNKTMGGVDLGDAQLYMYLAERRTMKWTTKVAFSLFGRAVLNSYLLYQMNTSDAPKLSRYMFMVSVVESLAGNHYPPQKVVRRRRTAAEIRAARDNPPPLVAPPPHQDGPVHPLVGHDLVKLPVGRKRNCAAGHATRVRSSWECPGCDVGLCPDCFATYHKRPRN